MDDSRISAAEMFPAQYAAHSSRKWIFQSPSKADMALKYAHAEAKLMLAARLEQTSIQSKERPC